MNTTMASTTPNAQRGATLLIGMVMLLMITLMAVSIIRLSMRHTQVVNNEQLRTEADAAANFALDLVLNQPLTAWSGYEGATGQTEYVNLGTSQSTDATDTSIAVNVRKLACKRGRVLKNKELVTTDPVTNVVQVSDPVDQSCIFSGSNSHLTFGSTTNTDDSLCATVLWEMEAQATDPKLLSATKTVTQGVEVRADIASYTDACK